MTAPLDFPVVLLVASSFDQPSERLQRVHFMIDDLDAGLVRLFHVRNLQRLPATTAGRSSSR
jgi:hypothetical protein